MPLSKEEKKLYTVPAAIALAIVVLLGLNWHISSENRDLQALLQQTDAQIMADHTSLSMLKNFDEHAQVHRYYNLDEWIPVFDNETEIRLYLTDRLQYGLAAVKAKETQTTWSIEETLLEPQHINCYLIAEFPSYRSLLLFLEGLEENTPPLLLQGVEITKVGIRINATLALRFGFRIKKDGAI